MTKKRTAKKTKPRSKKIRVVIAAESTSNNLAFTTERVQKFLQALIDTGSPTHAANAIDVTRRTVYNWRDRYPEFKAAWDEAHDAGVDALEQEARRRAMGYDEKIATRDGRIITVRKHSDLLLITLLNANRPEKFRQQRGEYQAPMSLDDQRRADEARDVLKRLSTEELSAIATVMEKATTRAVAQAVTQPKRTLQ